MPLSIARKPLSAALTLAGLAVLAAAPAHAQITYTFSGAGFEPTEAQRLFRDGNPSNAASGMKTYPGTFSEADKYQTFNFVNPFSTNAVFNVLITSPDVGTFYSVYNGSFNPTNLATNYLGDGGNSGSTGFSILATGSEKLILVLNTVGGVGTATTSTFTPSFTPAAVPEASTTVSLGLLLLLGLGGAVIAARKKLQVSAA